jgi:hypothetical protein
MFDIEPEIMDHVVTKEEVFSFLESLKDGQKGHSIFVNETLHDEFGFSLSIATKLYNEWWETLE